MSYVKYPRTYHLPYSESSTDDDKTLPSDYIFKDKEVVVTIKMDGENTTMYRDYIHARSIDLKKHESREWVKRLQGEIGYLIPEGMRICGENLFAKHSIEYKYLDSYFYAFSVWDGETCLSWDESLIYFEEFNLVHVPVIYRGIYNKEAILKAYKEYAKKEETEGFVVRLACEFNYTDFSKSVGKYVRKNHVQTSKHWMTEQIVPNKLKKT